MEPGPEPADSADSEAERRWAEWQAWEDERRKRDWKPVRVLWVVIICLAAIGGFLVAVAVGRKDSALLFVGLPAALALLLALLPAPRTVQGTVFVSITICLLMCAALVQEGAVCLLLASPLVYAIGHGVAALVTTSKRHLNAVLVLPLIAAAAVEGVVPGLRLEPVQTITLTRQVALAPAAVAERVAAGPEFGHARPLLLRAGYPTPDHAMGAGLSTGQYWHFGQHGGGILTQVTANRAYEGGRQVDFRVISDTSMTNHALIWRTARLRWAAKPNGRSEVRLIIVFERRLDPSWYFGPLENRFATAGGDYLLDSLGLAPA
jgi:hypothetical protein